MTRRSWLLYPLLAFLLTFSMELWGAPLVKSATPCHCPPAERAREFPSTSLQLRVFPLRVVTERDLLGRTVYEIAGAGVDSSKHFGFLNSYLRNRGALCPHESLRHGTPDSIAYLATKRGRDQLPVIIDNIADQTFFTPYWDELVARTRRDPNARAGTWRAAAEFAASSQAEVQARLRERYPGACAMPEAESEPLPQSVPVRTRDGRVVTMRVNVSHHATNASIAMALRAYDADDLWSWQAPDLPAGATGVWACDLDDDGNDEVVTVTWIEMDQLAVHVYRRDES